VIRATPCRADWTDIRAGGAVGSGRVTVDGDHAVRTSGQVGLLSVGGGMLTDEMSRHATFRFCLDPTVGQQQMLARHAGAARFAFNQCLRMVKTALTQRKSHPDIQVPWSGFDLINAFNGWKKTEGAGRVLAVDTGGVAEMVVTGLPWRAEVCQQVFEEAAVDCGRALAARSGCMTTPADCDACSPTAGPRFCSPPSATMQAAGGCR
jgi:hypothetical protein